MLDRLDAIETAVWAELARAPRSPRHPWRTPVLATADGDVADARTVVIREVEPGPRLLRFFTDTRSPKIAQLQRQPQGVLVMWSEALSWQLRLRVRFVVQSDGLAVSSRWTRLQMTPGAQDYLSPLPPGTPLANAPSPERSTRQHFGLVEAQVGSIDWLELRAGGHRRAIFDDQGARWVQP